MRFPYSAEIGGFLSSLGALLLNLLDRYISNIFKQQLLYNIYCDIPLLHFLFLVFMFTPFFFILIAIIQQITNAGLLWCTCIYSKKKKIILQ